MRNHKTGCGRCHRKVCCCPRPATSCLCPPGPPGPQGPPGPPGSNGSTLVGSALYKWSGTSASPTPEEGDTPAEHSDSGDGSLTDGAPRIEYPIVGDQTPDELRVNLLAALGGDDNVLTFTLYQRVGGVGAFIAIASVSYATGESGQKSDLGPFVLSDGDTIALESTATGENIIGTLFTAVLR